jgi:predicted RNase H-like HicB family nuclease
MTYPVVLEREADGRYSVWVPDLPGCASMGDTRDEALVNIREAVELYLDDLRAHGETPPVAASEVELVEVDAA